GRARRPGVDGSRDRHGDDRHAGGVTAATGAALRGEPGGPGGARRDGAGARRGGLRRELGSRAPRGRRASGGVVAGVVTRRVRVTGRAGGRAATFENVLLPIGKWLGGRDSNPDKAVQSRLSYR